MNWPLMKTRGTDLPPVMASMMSWQQRPDQLDPHTQTRAGAGLEGLSHHRTARHGPRHLPPALSVACSWALTGTLILSRPPSSAALSKPHAAHLDVLAVVPLIELHDLILDAELVHGLLGLQFAPSGYRHTDGAKKQCWRACALAQACARCVSMHYASIHGAHLRAEGASGLGKNHGFVAAHHAPSVRASCHQQGHASVRITC